MERPAFCSVYWQTVDQGVIDVVVVYKSNADPVT